MLSSDYASREFSAISYYSKSKVRSYLRHCCQFQAKVTLHSTRKSVVDPRRMHAIHVDVKARDGGRSSGAPVSGEKPNGGIMRFACFFSIYSVKMQSFKGNIENNMTTFRSSLFNLNWFRSRPTSIVQCTVAMNEQSWISACHREYNRLAEPARFTGRSRLDSACITGFHFHKIGPANNWPFRTRSCHQVSDYVPRSHVDSKRWTDVVPAALVNSARSQLKKFSSGKNDSGPWRVCSHIHVR